MVSEVPVLLAYRLAMSRLRIDAGLLSTVAPASHRGVQAESVNGADAATHCLWLSWIYQKRDHGPASAPSSYSAGLHVGLAGAANLLLDLS